MLNKNFPSESINNYYVSECLLSSTPLINTDSDDDEGSNEMGRDNPPETGNPRASLMDAIRQAGGAGKAGLKNAKSKKSQRKAKKEVEESPADLLGDLSAVLGRRRKALSGRDKSAAGDTPSSGGGGMMDKISAMIPPPPPPGGGGDDSDGDSEEENTW